jgi:hypothetical protein
MNGEYGKWKFFRESAIGADDIRPMPIGFWHFFVGIHLIMTTELFDSLNNDSRSISRVSP